MSAQKKCQFPLKSATKPDAKAEKKPENKNVLKIVTPDLSQNIMQKNAIEQMKKIISNKIKDPKLAKRAAQIISEMLNSKK